MIYLRKRLNFTTAQVLLLLALYTVTSMFGIAMALNLAVASGKDVYKKGGAVVDASNSDQGYIMIKRESKKKQKVRITKDKMIYDYDLNGEGRYEVYPLQMGSGKYNVAVYENKSGSNYSSKFSKDIKVNLVSEEIPFTYPNRLINYDENTRCVALAEEICAGLDNDMDKVKAVNAYVTKNIMYDYMLATQITGGSVTSYVPDIDAVLDKKMGICFDYSAVVACMLRSQGIPTKLVMGYASKQYHAWNLVYIDGKWGRMDTTFAVTKTKAEYSDPDKVF